jgi:hypothetical protein
MARSELAYGVFKDRCSKQITWNGKGNANISRVSGEPGFFKEDVVLDRSFRSTFLCLKPDAHDCARHHSSPPVIYVLPMSQTLHTWTKCFLFPKTAQLRAMCRQVQHPGYQTWLLREAWTFKPRVQLHSEFSSPFLENDWIQDTAGILSIITEVTYLFNSLKPSGNYIYHLLY